MLMRLSNETNESRFAREKGTVSRVSACPFERRWDLLLRRSEITRNGSADAELSVNREILSRRWLKATANFITRRFPTGGSKLEPTEPAFHAFVSSKH